jgi:hypothetical protein
MKLPQMLRPGHLTQLAAGATAGYGVYALVQPRHLGKALQAPVVDRPMFDLLARTYGVRDLAISGFGLTARSRSARTTAAALRIASDLGDAALLGAWASDPQIRRKVLAVTLGWAGLNAAALAADLVWG